MKVDENNESQTTNAEKDRRPDALGNLCVLPDEILCSILFFLSPRDVARLSCVSSVMYIICNEDPLWMGLCLNTVNQQLQYKGSWKRTTLHQLDLPDEVEKPWKAPLHFSGFNSLFLYKRFYRCYTNLSGFSFDNGNVDRKRDLSLDEFKNEYDGQKPVLISGLADSWPARHSWSIEQLLLNYGDSAFRISQRSSQKINMKFKDYVSYIKLQHDEDPLYIFDDKFGEVAPGLLKDYSVPYLFQEDLFDVLDIDKRPPFRWFIIGPERSGASWHVDPALTSAWNTLLCGRKRWALYPPGRVPLGVTVHVDEEDGDVNIDTPSSLQWWLDFYPLLADEDKPFECTQLPGETIFVPSGWWHCVLNIEPTVAVTQNFVNSKNFEYVCLDMAPGYQHKGVCRAGLLAVDEGVFEQAENNTPLREEDGFHSDLTRKEKRIRICRSIENLDCEKATKASEISSQSQNFSYDINFLSTFLDGEKDHFNSLWCSNNCIGQREMREWLSKLWVGKPGLRDLIWKGACLALNTGKWSQCVEKICAFHGLPFPTDDEKLPVGTGSNPVYLISGNVIKIFVEGGLEASLHCLGTELQFYSLMHKVGSPLKICVPEVLASGILLFESESYKVIPWDGKGVPDVIENSDLCLDRHNESDYPFGIWSKKEFEYKKSGMSAYSSDCSSGSSRIWPYIITKRCKGKIFAELRDNLTWEAALNLASFLGEQVRNLHLLPCPPSHLSKLQLPYNTDSMEDAKDEVIIPPEWKVFIRTLNRQRKLVCCRLTKWGDPIPKSLIEKVEEYLPDDFAKLITLSKDDNRLPEGCKSWTWVHSDIMDDNIHMEEFHSGSADENGSGKSWRPSHILDFSDLSIGEPICDIIPMYLDVFRGDRQLLKHFLDSYNLPLVRRKSMNNLTPEGSKLERNSYLAMCYCILHEENVLGAIFSLWKELRVAKSWEEVEETVWGDLNNYTGVSSVDESCIFLAS